MLRCVVIGMIIGVATELVARVSGLWIYQQPQTPILNVVAIFGFVMGGVASWAKALGLLPCFVIGFVIGLLYEIANLRVLKWWYFPGERLAFIHGHVPIVVVLAVLWGLVPPMIAVAQATLPKVRGTAVSGETRLDRLNQREKQLMEKLEALRQREREVETNLDEVRLLKQALLARQAVRQPGAHDASPLPTP